MRKIHVFTLFALFFNLKQTITAQNTYTKDDTLRGSITPERAWWDLNFYDLKVKINPDEKTISGSNTIVYTVLKNHQVMQIDLQPPLSIERILQDKQPLNFNKIGKNAYLIALKKNQQKGNKESLTVYYSGKPLVAKRAPWDGGFSWSKDREGNHFIATSCQGLGASIWWPCKDHMYDEPDSMNIAVTVPKNLIDVSNGRLRQVIDNQDDTKTFEWTVNNPINNYGVNINIGNYRHFTDTFKGEKGDLTLDFYVLPENLTKAQTQFQQVKQMLKAFEHWFGPYPFYEDGYKLVEVPYLGMEHQSSITYGNGYQNGYRGRDLSGTGWGLKWDFIIVHESGHEWFANNITYKDMADMWIHESFTNYSENLFTEYYYGKEAGAAYVIGCRTLIENKKPIISDYNVNAEGSGDMYYKGGNMLHTIRQIVNDDEKWRQILRGLNATFYHQTVETKQVETYISKQAGRDLSKVFDQYLRDIRIPVLEYVFKKNTLEYRWANCVKGFNMPVKVSFDGKNYRFIYPDTNWQKLKTKEKLLVVDEGFYVTSAGLK
jgi:aminopeptidase N